MNNPVEIQCIHLSLWHPCTSVLTLGCTHMRCGGTSLVVPLHPHAIAVSPLPCENNLLSTKEVGVVSATVKPYPILPFIKEAHCTRVVRKVGCLPPPVATGPRVLNSAPYNPW